VEGYFATATCRFRIGSSPPECSWGNVHVGWLAWSQLSMPPYEPPVTAIRSGSTSGYASATRAASHWVSRIS